MRTIVTTCALVIGALGSIAVADDDDVTDPQQITDQEADTLAARIATWPTANLELASLGDTVQLARGRLGGTGDFHRDQLGLGIDYRVTCRDEDDAPIAVCSSDTRNATASVEAQGGSETAAQQSSLRRGAQWTLANVNADEPPTIDGTAYLDHEVTDTFAGDKWTEHTRYEATYRGVAVSVANGGDARPIGGTIDYAIRSTRAHADGEPRALATTAHVEFGEDGSARLEVAGRHYHIDSPLGNLQRD